MADLIETLHKKGDATTKIYPNIKGVNIPNSAITSEKINDGAIITNKIADNQITTAKLVDGAITTNKIVDGNVTTNKLDDGAVTTAKISNGSITSDKLQTASVSTSKIEDGAVTIDKLDPNINFNPKQYKHVYIIEIGQVRYMIDFINNENDDYITNGVADDRLYGIINKLIFMGAELKLIKTLGETSALIVSLYDMDNTQYVNDVVTINGTDVEWNNEVIFTFADMDDSGVYIINTADFILEEI